MAVGGVGIPNMLTARRSADVTSIGWEGSNSTKLAPGWFESVSSKTVENQRVSRFRCLWARVALVI